MLPLNDVDVLRETASTLQTRPCIFIAVRGRLRVRSGETERQLSPRSSERYSRCDAK